jgi:hypothetical protein
MKLTAKVAKILRKDRKELKNMVLPLYTLHFPCLPAGRLAYFAVYQNKKHE